MAWAAVAWVAVGWVVMAGQQGVGNGVVHHRSRRSQFHTDTRCLLRPGRRPGSNRCWHIRRCCCRSLAAAWAAAAWMAAEKATQMEAAKVARAAARATATATVVVTVGALEAVKAVEPAVMAVGALEAVAKAAVTQSATQATR